MSQSLLHTPIGPIRLFAEGEMLSAIHVGGDWAADTVGEQTALLREAAAQLHAFFAGRLTRFDLPLAAAATPRGPAHRAAIEAIGYGCTASYGELARALGSSPRAVGQACRRNPFPIVIPCHRVLGAGATLGHYSAGDGPPTKSWLLNHERKGR